MLIGGCNYESNVLNGGVNTKSKQCKEDQSVGNGTSNSEVGTAFGISQSIDDSEYEMKNG